MTYVDVLPPILWFAGLLCAGASVMRKVRRAEPGDFTFFLTDFWALNAGLASTLWLSSKVIDLREINGWAVLAMITICQLIGVAAMRLRLAPVKSSESPSRLKHAGAVVAGVWLGYFCGAIAWLVCVLVAIIFEAFSSLFWILFIPYFLILAALIAREANRAK